MASRLRNFLDGKNNFDVNQVTSIHKAINKEDTPTKIKHVRSIIIATHHEQGLSTFWATVSKLPLQSSGPLCWKFCHVLHKVCREGHSHVIVDSMKYLTYLEDLCRVWGHLPENFGPINSHYLKQLTNRLNFHKKHIEIPGNMEITDSVIADITGNEANGYFEFCIELLDLMDDIVNLQSVVFHQLDRSYDNSMTPTGQCKLYPLVLAVQDSCQLYDYLVKILFKLHKVIPPETLGDLRTRFSGQYKLLKQFYQTCDGLQFYKGLIQVPTLPDLPPNFLVASEIFKHRKPVAVVAGEEAEEESAPTPPPAAPVVESLVDTTQQAPTQPAPDARDTIISQLRTQVEHLQNQLEFVKTKARERIAELNTQIDSLNAQLTRQRQEAELSQSQVGALKVKVSELQREGEELKENLSTAETNAAAAASLSKAAEHAKSSDERYKKMREVYEKLRQEHVTLLRTGAAIKKQSAADKQLAEEKQQQLNEVVEEVTRLKSEQAVMQESVQKSSEESSQHTAMLEERIRQLDAQKAEYEESLIASEGEREKLRAEVTEYQATASSLESDLKLQREDGEQTTVGLQQQLGSVRDELDTVQASAANLDEQNKKLSQQLEELETEKATQQKSLSDKVSTLEANLAGLTQQRDEAVEAQASLQSELASRMAQLEEEMTQRTAEAEANRRKEAYQSLGLAVDKGVQEVHFTLDHISSEEFISHTCNADAAVEDLGKLDGELTEIFTALESGDDMLKLSHLVHSFSHRLCRTLEESKAACNRAPPDQGDELAERCNTLGEDSIAWMSTLKSEYAEDSPDKAALKSLLEKVRSDTEGMLGVARSLILHGDDVNVSEIGELVEEELNATQQAIEEGANKIQEMLEKARLRDTGVKLEVNEKILDSVTKLMAEIQQLVRKSKDLQAEIVASGRGSASAKEFYKKNHRWTEGLVSAAKAVGWGASTLVEKAEKIMEGKGTLNELKVCSNEIAASTAQLVVSSQVKADKESQKLSDLKHSAKGVKSATADVVASSNFGQQMIEDADLMNFSDLSLTQTKKEEMNTQVYILELESKLVKERKRLAEIRKRHYQLAGESEGWERAAGMTDDTN
ncbi:huntingtin-interacting protein 1-like isoform X2 [Watersipora subatra]|uniref:huntingtin-interacting protein 1-like isoform X2 n=1 Tax=Watersipora subatra TaxID=2589382 RepID=UPI00355B7EBF